MFWKIDLVIDSNTQVSGIYWSIFENTAYDKFSGLTFTITHNKISERNNKSFLFLPQFLTTTHYGTKDNCSTIKKLIDI